jgi:hypothetical protein
MKRVIVYSCLIHIIFRLTIARFCNDQNTNIETFINTDHVEVSLTQFIRFKKFKKIVTDAEKKKKIIEIIKNSLLNRLKDFHGISTKFR